MGYSFIIKGKWGGGRETTFFLISSSSTSGGVVFSCPYMVKVRLSWHKGNKQKVANIHKNTANIYNVISPYSFLFSAHRQACPGNH